MALYKEARYKPSKNTRWQDVDTYLHKAVEYYWMISKDKKQPQFIDIVTKTIICRAYVNIKNKKLLTAEKILENAKKLIVKIQKGELEVSSENREGAAIIPLDILNQKYLLHKGYLSIALNKDQDACFLFTQCLRTGKEFDPRIRKECVIQLRQIFRKYGQGSESLERMMKSFEHRNKDIVFLVNN